MLAALSRILILRIFLFSAIRIKRAIIGANFHGDVGLSFVFAEQISLYRDFVHNRTRVAHAFVLCKMYITFFLCLGLYLPWLNDEYRTVGYINADRKIYDHSVDEWNTLNIGLYPQVNDGDE